MLSFVRGFYWKPDSFLYSRSKLGAAYLVCTSAPITFLYRGEEVTASLSYAAHRQGNMHSHLVRCLSNDNLVLQIRSESPELLLKPNGEAKAEGKIFVVSKDKADDYNHRLADRAQEVEEVTLLVQILVASHSPCKPAPTGFQITEGKVRFGGAGKWKRVEEVNLTWVRSKLNK